MICQRIVFFFEIPIFQKGHSHQIIDKYMGLSEVNLWESWGIPEGESMVVNMAEISWFKLGLATHKLLGGAITILKNDRLQISWDDDIEFSIPN